MILFFLDYLREVWGVTVPAVFGYYSTRMILSALTSLSLTIFLGPLFIRKLYELKIGQTIRKEECPLLGVLHEKKQDTPTMGGILILFSMIVSLLLWMDLKNIFTLILFVTTLGLGTLGALDDYLKLKYKNTKGLAPRRKFLFQILFSTLLGIYLIHPTIAEKIHKGKWFSPPVAKEFLAMDKSGGNEPVLLSHHEYSNRIYMPFLKKPIGQLTGGIGIIITILLIVFVVTSWSNAVNLTDGLDGLAAGCLLMVALTLAIIGFLSNNIDLAKYLHILYIEGSGEIAVYLCAFAGGCLGFLWYNGHPAQVFMGDTGSLALGGIIGVSAILLKRELLLGFVGGIFVIEALSVVLQVLSYRYRNRKRIFLCAPLHHHFEYKGWQEPKVVIRFWIIGFLLALLGLASLKFQ